MATKLELADAVRRAEQSVRDACLVVECEDGSHFSFDTLFHGTVIFSLVSPAGERYTYSVDEGERKWAGHWFVSLLAGPDNVGDYRRMGRLLRDGSLNLQGSYTGNALPVAAFRWLVASLRDGNPLPEGVRIVPSGHCRRCRKLLTVEQGPDNPFRKFNLGPVCGLKVFGG